MFDEHLINQVYETCKEAVEGGSTNTAHLTIVMLYTKLAEMKMGLQLCTETTSGLLESLKTPYSEGFEVITKTGNYADDTEREVTPRFERAKGNQLTD